MEEMQRKMAEAQEQNGRNSGFSSQNPTNTPPKSSIKPSSADADYIDFEELK